MYSMNDLSQRRAVVYQVLKKVIPHEECMQAMWILENNYTNLTVVPILEYVDCIEQEVSSFGEEKMNISRELTKLLYSPDTDEHNDPWQEMQRFRMYATDPSPSDMNVTSKK